MPDSSSELNLWKKQLGRVPDSVWEQTELESLVLAENELSEVSEQIGRLKQLRMLDLGHNKLTQLPENLAEIEGLTDFLYLHDNRLASIRDSLFADLTHAQPLVPETLELLARQAGFGSVEIRFLNEPEQHPDTRISEQLFAALDYALIARK